MGNTIGEGWRDRIREGDFCDWELVWEFRSELVVFDIERGYFMIGDTVASVGVFGLKTEVMMFPYVYRRYQYNYPVYQRCRPLYVKL